MALLSNRFRNPNAWRSAYLMAAIAVSVLPVSLIGALAPAIENSFGFGPSMIGEVTALAFACSSAAAVASGWAVDRLGGRGVLVGSMAGLIVSSFSAGLATQRPILICAVILSGICSGTIPPATYRLLSDHITAARQGSAFGVIQAGFPGAVVFAGLIAPGVASGFGWRAVFFGASVPTGIVACCAFLFFNAPLDSRHDAAGRRAAGAVSSRVRSRRGTLMLLGTASVLGNAGAGVLTTYFVVFCISRSSSNGLADYYFALGGVAAVGARLVFGRWVDGHRGQAGSMTTALLVGGAVGVALLSLPVAWLTIPSTILAFGSGWGWTGLLGLTVTQIFASTPGLSTALVITAAGGVGAAAGPAIASMLLSLAGYPLAWGFAAACFLGSAIAVWHMNRLLVTDNGFGAHIRDGPPGIEPAADPYPGYLPGSECQTVDVTEKNDADRQFD